MLGYIWNDYSPKPKLTATQVHKGLNGALH